MTPLIVEKCPVMHKLLETCATQTSAGESASLGSCADANTDDPVRIVA
jgi:hypothetical protein